MIQPQEWMMRQPVPDTANKSDKTEIEPTNMECTSGAMNLHRQPRKECNRKNYNNVFNITDETQKDGNILMQLKCKEDLGTFDVTEKNLTSSKPNTCS